VQLNQVGKAGDELIKVSREYGLSHEAFFFFLIKPFTTYPKKEVVIFIYLRQNGQSFSLF
jgi:hypothetical protein